MKWTFRIVFLLVLLQCSVLILEKIKYIQVLHECTKIDIQVQKYEMVVEGAYNNMMVALNENEEIEIIECPVCI